MLLDLDDLDIARSEMEAMAEQSPLAPGQKKERTLMLLRASRA